MGMAWKVGFGRHWLICSLHFAESITIRPWFEGQKEERSFVTSVSIEYIEYRIMSGHSSVRLHLDKFRIVEYPMCECLQDYETVDHFIWHCE
jgi:hypothetical protein